MRLLKAITKYNFCYFYFFCALEKLQLQITHFELRTTKQSVMQKTGKRETSKKEN